MQQAENDQDQFQGPQQRKKVMPLKGLPAKQISKCLPQNGRYIRPAERERAGEKKLRLPNNESFIG